MKREIRLVGHFTKIHLKDFGKLILSQGDQESLTIEADEDIINELVSIVTNETLILGLAEDWVSRLGKLLSSVFINKDKNISYFLTCTNLDAVHIGGKSDLECSSLDAENLDLKISGLGKMQFSHLDCDSLDVTISGRGEFKAAGRADRQQVRISGSGEYETPQLESQSMRITITGQGNVTVRVSESLDITISGLGYVNYYGHPQVRQVITGLGQSQRLNES